MTYVHAAVTQLYDDAGVMTDKGFSDVLKEGRKSRIRYYKGRVADFSEKQLQALTLPLVESAPDSGVSYETIMQSLTSHYEKAEAQHLFDLALYTGAWPQTGREGLPLLFRRCGTG